MTTPGDPFTALLDELHAETTRCGPRNAMSSNTVLDRALAYARHGWPVFPCHPGEKTPPPPTATVTPPPTRPDHHLVHPPVRDLTGLRG